VLPKAGWTNNNQNFPPVPLAFTEINFTASLTNNDTASLGNYLVDLFTWLYDHNTPRYTDVSSSQLRTMWYQGADSGAFLGIYQGQAGGSPTVEKQVTMQHCSSQPNIGTSQHSVAWDYYYLRNDHCY